MKYRKLGRSGLDVSAVGLEIGETPFDEISEISFGREGFSCGSVDSFVTELPQLNNKFTH